MRQRVFSDFRNDSRGAVAATYALSLTALVAIAGVAFDYARLAGMDSELQNGADQAALAGATQLSREDGSCARATNAAIALLNNETLLANDVGERAVQINGGLTIAIADDACTTSGVVFWVDKAKTTQATTDETANFIEVTVDARIAEYAFTPIVGALNSGNINASAMAGLGSAICKVPPIMVCHPDPTISPPIDWDTYKGRGVLATGHSPGGSSNQGGGAGSGTAPGSGSWSPGNFGFLQVEKGDANSTNAALLQALAFNNPPIDCVPIGENKVSTGNPQGLYDAINTRFGIYDFPSGGGSTLGPCQAGACTKAPNVIMDLVQTGNGNGVCKLRQSNANNGNGGKGFAMPTTPFAPTYQGATTTSSTKYDPAENRMGLPRDLCHYQTYDETGTLTVDKNDASTYADGICTGGRFGDGKWARADYWETVHGQTIPSGLETATRYETYLHEIANSATLLAGKGHTCGVTGDVSRRVLTIAIVSNCSELNGTSQPVVIDEFVDVFLVEPSLDTTRRYNAYKDSIYMEIIGKSTLAGNGVFGSQEVRRDVPYLLE